LADGRTRLVAGRTVLLWSFYQDVNRPTFPFYRDRATTDATTYRLGADTKDLGSLGYGRTPFVPCAVVRHGPMLYPSEATCKSLEQIPVPLTRTSTS
jgi:hypothetical protein